MYQLVSQFMTGTGRTSSRNEEHAYMTQTNMIKRNHTIRIPLVRIICMNGHHTKLRIKAGNTTYGRQTATAKTRQAKLDKEERLTRGVHFQDKKTWSTSKVPTYCSK